MKLRFSSAVFAAVVTAATITFAQGAQAPTPEPQQPQNPATSSQAPPARGQESAAEKVTLTGCLQQAPSEPASGSQAGSSGNPGAAPSASDSNANPRFILAHAMTADEAAGKTTTAPGASEGRTYALIANASALSPHLGKKVELTGTLEGQPPAEKLRVESGKALPTSCE